MNIDCAEYRVAEGAEIQLTKRSTRVKPLYESHKH
jgi:hypothetical protein